MESSQGLGESEAMSSRLQALASPSSFSALFATDDMDESGWLPPTMPDMTNAENDENCNLLSASSSDHVQPLQRATSSDALSAAEMRETQAINDFLAGGRKSNSRMLGNGLSFNNLVTLRDSNNYNEWASSIRAAARKEGVWHLILGHCTKPLEPSESCSPEEKRIYSRDLLFWVDQNDLALGGLEGSLDLNVRMSLDDETFDNARDLWLALEKKFKPQSKVDLYHLLLTLGRMTLDDSNGSISKFAGEIQDLRRHIMRSTPTTEVLPPWFFTFTFIRGLGERFLPFIHDVLSNTDNSQGLLGRSFESVILQAIEFDSLQRGIEGEHVRP
jgi:hypothetical protein